MKRLGKRFNGPIQTTQSVLKIALLDIGHVNKEGD